MGDSSSMASMRRGIAAIRSNTRASRRLIRDYTYLIEHIEAVPTDHIVDAQACRPTLAQALHTQADDMEHLVRVIRRYRRAVLRRHAELTGAGDDRG